jgi:hypothetical protein
MPVDTITYTVRQGPRTRRITFTGTDHLAQEHYVHLETSDVGYDPEATKDGIRQSINESLKKNEVNQWLANEEMPVVATHATKQRHASTWRAQYKDAVREEHFRLGYKMYRDYLLGNFTDAQLMTAFEMTQLELDDFMGRVQIAHDHFVTTKVGVGE